MRKQPSFLRNCTHLLLRATSQFDASLGAGNAAEKATAFARASLAFSYFLACTISWMKKRLIARKHA